MAYESSRAHSSLPFKPGISALKNVDIAPLIPLIENAGGVVTTWDGGRAEAGGNCIAAATKGLHAEALEVLNA